MQLRIGNCFFDSKLRILHLIGCGSYDDYRNDYNRATMAVLKNADPEFKLFPGMHVDDLVSYICLEADLDDYEQMLNICHSHKSDLIRFVFEKSRPNVIICWGWKWSINTSSSLRCLCEVIFERAVKESYYPCCNGTDVYGTASNYCIINWKGPWQNGYDQNEISVSSFGIFGKKEIRRVSKISRRSNRGSSFISLVFYSVVMICLWYLPIVLGKPDIVRYSILITCFLSLILPYIKNRSPIVFFRTLQGTSSKFIALIGGLFFIIQATSALFHPEEISYASVSLMIVIPLLHGMIMHYRSKKESSVLHSTAFFDSLTIYFQLVINMFRPVKDGAGELGIVLQYKYRFFSVQHHSKIDSSFFWKRTTVRSTQSDGKRNSTMYEEPNYNDSSCDSENKEDQNNGSFNNQSQMGNDSGSFDTDLKQLLYLKLLGVTESATDEEITRAYREQIKRYHPDLFVNDSLEMQKEMETMTKQLNEAFEYLIEKKQRERKQYK